MGSPTELAWSRASQGVYPRDIAQVVGIIASMLMFLSPLFFPLAALPEQMRLVVGLNPLWLPVELPRQVLLGGQAPNWINLLLYAAMSLAAMRLGFWWLQRTRRGFSGVI